MLTEQTFVQILNKWDSLFTHSVLSKAYKHLSNDPAKKYVVAVMDGLQTDFTVNQSTDREVKSALTEYIRRYREESIAYIPRILIIDLNTAEEYRDPTEWTVFLLSKN